ncbi:MAG TPA: ABC transporter permease [Candidatus Saccharimonadales bacterium]|jgi:ABC-2 type transport system permease protein|nr:ABC transporter permease [Candidatus Saccharimonadales bacterium]
MHKLLLIAKREYLERVRTRSFLIMTLLIPALMFGITVVPTLIANRMDGGPKHLVVVASSEAMGEAIRAELEAGRGQPTRQEPEKNVTSKRNEMGAPRFIIDVDTNTSDAERDALTGRLKSKQINGVLWATSGALTAREVTFITTDLTNLGENFGIQEGLSRVVRQQLLKSKGMTNAEITAALKPVDLKAQSPMGAGGPNPEVLFLAIFAMVMVLYMAVFLYGMNVMRAVLDEKSSRVMEVMLSTASAKEMMAGKIVGVGAVGLTQVAIWVCASGVLSSGFLIAGADALKGLMSLKVLVFFTIFFLLGYALYATLCAAVGSMVNSEQEAQQLQFLVAAPLLVSVIIMLNVVQNPASQLALWASLVPFTAPLIMFVRIAVQTPGPPAWQIALSLALLVVTTYGLVVVCGRVYRIGILMYGKKPTLPEILKWIKYA